MPLSEAEARAAFDHLAGMGDRIPFGYLAEGCEVRSQLMLDELGRMGIEAERAWLLPVPGIVLKPPGAPGTRWRNHTAPSVSVENTPDGVRVLDPSLPGVGGPLTVAAWAARSGLASSVRLERPESQAEMLARFGEHIMSGRAIDGFVVVVPLGVRPATDVLGSKFRLEADPPEGVAEFVRQQAAAFLLAQRRSRDT